MSVSQLHHLIGNLKIGLQGILISVEKDNNSLHREIKMGVPIVSPIILEKR